MSRATCRVGSTATDNMYAHNMSFDRSKRNLMRFPVGSVVKHTWLPKDSLEEQVWEGKVTSYNESLQTLTVSYDASYDVDSPEEERRELEGQIPLLPSVGMTKGLVVAKKKPPPSSRAPASQASHASHASQASQATTSETHIPMELDERDHFNQNYLNEDEEDDEDFVDGDINGDEDSSIAVPASRSTPVGTRVRWTGRRSPKAHLVTLEGVIQKKPREHGGNRADILVDNKYNTKYVVCDVKLADCVELRSCVTASNVGDGARKRKAEDEEHTGQLHRGKKPRVTHNALVLARAKQISASQHKKKNQDVPLDPRILLRAESLYILWCAVYSSFTLALGLAVCVPSGETPVLPAVYTMALSR